MIELTAKQAALLRGMWQRKRQADREWSVAMVLLDIDPSRIVGGDLDAVPPYLEIQIEEPVTS